MHYHKEKERTLTKQERINLFHIQKWEFEKGQIKGKLSVMEPSSTQFTDHVIPGTLGLSQNPHLWSRALKYMHHQVVGVYPMSEQMPVHTQPTLDVHLR